jgi:long-chain fatty acid transport protein
MSARAGGLYVHEFGTPSMGTASAGAQAVATDASTAGHNPAGMTRIEGNQFMLAGGLLYSDVHFDRDPATPVLGSSGGDAGDFAPMLGSYYVRTISERWRFGFASFTLVGAALDYEDDWAGRYQCQEVSILTVSFNPTLAYKLSDELSVAAGVGAMYGELDLEAAIPLGPFPDGKAEIDGDDWTYGWNLGLLYEMTEYTRLGVLYWSNMDLEFSGDAKISPIGARASIDTDLPLPQLIRGGFYHDLNDKWAVLGTVSWEEWSRLDNVNLSTSRGTTPIPKNWDDTWQYALGFHYRPNNKWLLQTGISYDTSPTSPSDRTADMPVDQQIRYAVGGQYKWSETFSIGGAFEYIDLGSAKINSPTLIGEYDRNAIFALGLNANWKF